MGKLKRKPKKTRELSIGEEMIRDMRELARTLETEGMDAVRVKFRATRPMPLLPPAPALTPAEIAAARFSVEATVPMFAALLGVSEATVRAWEQGAKKPTPTARRLLDEARRDPAYWRARLTPPSSPAA